MNLSLFLLSAFILAVYPAEALATNFGKKHVNTEYYSQLRTAMEAKRNASYAEASKMLYKLLPSAATNQDKAFIHDLFVEIYRDMGNMELELKHLKLHKKFTLNKDLKKRSDDRVKEIHKIRAEREAIQSRIQVKARHWDSMTDLEKQVSLLAIQKLYASRGVHVKKPVDFYLSKLNQVDMGAPQIQDMYIRDLFEVIATSNADFNPATHGVETPAMDALQAIP